MALSIGPGESRLARTTQSLQNNRTNSARSNELSQANLALKSNEPSEAKAARDAAATSTVTPRQAEERRATSILFRASVSLEQKTSATKELISTVDNLVSLAKEIKNEVNPERRAQLEAEAESLREDAEDQFASAVEENPSLAQEESITAVIKPGASAEDSAKVFSTRVAKASSLADLGVSSLSFDDPDATIEQLESASASLRGSLQSFESTKRDLASAVETRGSAIAAENEAESKVNPEQRAEELARAVAASAENIATASQTDQLDVQGLLDEQAEENEEQSEDEGSSGVSQQSESDSSVEASDEEDESLVATS